jgi:anti-sigma factor RsiW
MTEDRTNDARKKADKALQEIRVKGNQLVDRVREVLEEGNARRILVKKDGRTVMEFPLSVGVGGAAAAILLSPTLAALGAFASLASDIHVVVERYDPSAEDAVVRTTTSETTTTE